MANLRKSIQRKKREAIQKTIEDFISMAINRNIQLEFSDIKLFRDILLKSKNKQQQTPHLLLVIIGIVLYQRKKKTLIISSHPKAQVIYDFIKTTIHHDSNINSPLVVSSIQQVKKNITLYNEIKWDRIIHFTNEYDVIQNRNESTQHIQFIM